MNGEELENEFYLNFVTGGDGIDVSHKSVVTDNLFIIIFETGREEQSGDITSPKFMNIWNTIINFRKTVLESTNVVIDVTITTLSHFYYQISQEVSEKDFARSLDVSDSTWHHDFYIFVTFRNAK